MTTARKNHRAVPRDCITLDRTLIGKLLNRRPSMTNLGKVDRLRLDHAAILHHFEIVEHG
jgi:hypothetical protein